jgi:hypothetical protein
MVANDEAAVVVNFYEVLGHDPAPMASVCAANGLFDVHAQVHGSAAAIPTYARGSRLVDYCIASVALEPHVNACGFNLFNENIYSDHRASFVDLALKVFIGHDAPSLTRPDMRFVSTSSPDVNKFVQKMYMHLANNMVFHQFEDFCLDADVSADSWRATNKSTPPSDTPFPPPKNTVPNPQNHHGPPNSIWPVSRFATGKQR